MRRGDGAGGLAATMSADREWPPDGETEGEELEGSAYEELSRIPTKTQERRSRSRIRRTRRTRREERAGPMAALRLGRADHPHRRRCLGPDPVHHPGRPERGPHGRADLAVRGESGCAGPGPWPDPEESGGKAGSARSPAPADADAAGRSAGVPGPGRRQPGEYPAAVFRSTAGLGSTAGLRSTAGPESHSWP